MICKIWLTPLLCSTRPQARDKTSKQFFFCIKPIYLIHYQNTIKIIQLSHKFHGVYILSQKNSEETCFKFSIVNFIFKDLKLLPINRINHSK